MLLVVMAMTSLYFPLHAQLRSVSISTLADVSEYVLEGRITAKEMFWNDDETRIYTLYQIEVVDYLKGNGPTNLEVVQIGGCVDEYCQTLYPTLEMGLGTSGVLFLRSFQKERLHSDALLEVVSGPLGFVQFIQSDGREFGANALEIFENLDREIYIPISGRPRKTSMQPIAMTSRAVPGIDSISPDTVAAGVNDTLTIYGTEFGMTKGKVWFQNADFPPGVFMHGENPDLVVWTDTLIRVLVPSEGSLDSMRRGSAGSGPVRVETNNGMVTESTVQFVVPYGLKTRRVSYDSTTLTVILSSPYDTPVGGYQFRYDSAFAASPGAVSVFEKSLRDWRCASLINWTVGSDTAITEIATDKISIVFWDSLPPGVIGQTMVHIAFCKDEATGLFYYHVPEVDIVFSNTANFHYDTIAAPAANQDDFYSITLHELGHAHLLQHIIRPGFLMDFQIALGSTIRTIHPEMLTGARRAIDTSTVSHNVNCFLPHVPIQPGNCNTLNAHASSLNFSGSVYVFPNPTNDKVNVQVKASQPVGLVDVQLIDVYGKVLQSETVFLQPSTVTDLKMNTHDLPDGYYLVRIGNALARITKSVIIQH